jgi:hypothetical protein
MAGAGIPEFRDEFAQCGVMYVGEDVHRCRRSRRGVEWFAVVKGTDADRCHPARALVHGDNGVHCCGRRRHHRTPQLVPYRRRVRCCRRESLLWIPHLFETPGR